MACLVRLMCLLLWLLQLIQAGCIVMLDLERALSKTPFTRHRSAWSRIEFGHFAVIFTLATFYMLHRKFKSFIVNGVEA